MITIGVDAHKRTHTLVAVDQVGRKVAEVTVPATPDGHARAVDWARQWPVARFAVEDCRHVTRRLEADLLVCGFEVVRVKTQLMATARRTGRVRGKSDPIDALAVAVAAVREPDLPVARLDGPEREVKLISDHRRRLVCQRTELVNKARWFLHEIDPELQVPARGLRRLRVIDDTVAALAGNDSVLAAVTVDMLGLVRNLTVRINALERDLKTRVEALAPSLLAIPGCGVLSAAVIIGETADVTRFRDRNAYAAFNGTAPIPVWSASVRMRLNRGGNRQVNWALHMIAVTQAARGGPGRAYLDKQLARGKTPVEARRLLRRRISDAVYRALCADQARATTAPSTTVQLEAA